MCRIYFRASVVVLELMNNADGSIKGTYFLALLPIVNDHVYVDNNKIIDIDHTYRE